MNSSDVIHLVQPYLAARLQSLDYFQDIYVAAPRMWTDGEKLHTPKSILEEANNALTGLIETGGKVGAAVKVFQPTMSVDKPSGRQGKITLVCRCEVEPTVNWEANGTQKYVSHIAYQVLRAGLGFAVLQGFCTLYAEGAAFLPYLNEEGGFETVDVIFNCNVGVSPLLSVVTPLLSTDGAGNVTLTNQTAGAAIYYVTVPASNGIAQYTDVFPGPQTPQAKQYTGPFAVPAGTDVIWAAYLAGQAGSNVGFQTITY